MRLLSGTSPAVLSGVAPTNISYQVGNVGSVSLTMGNTPAASNNLTLDFSGGNPIPSQSTIGLNYNAGNGLDNILSLQGNLPDGSGGPGFVSEVHNANDPSVNSADRQYGSIAFVDQNNTATQLTYGGVTPITDTTPAVNYTFNDFGYPDQSFSASTGARDRRLPDPRVRQHAHASLPDQLRDDRYREQELRDVQHAARNSGRRRSRSQRRRQRSARLRRTVEPHVQHPHRWRKYRLVRQHPARSRHLLERRRGADVTNVTGLGIADGTVLFLNGGAGVNTLNYDAGGQTPTVTPGLLPGEVLVSIPGAGIVDAINYQQINITDVTPHRGNPRPGGDDQ